MKVAIVRRGWSATGGAEAYLLRLAGALAAAGHEPRLISSGWPEDKWPHGPITELPGKSPHQFASAFASLPKAKDEVVFSLERVPGCDIFRAGDGVHDAWLQRRKYFEPIWKAWFRSFNPKHRALLDLESQVFDPQRTRAIICNSKLVTEEICTASRYPRERIFVVRNGFDPVDTPATQNQRESARRALGLDPHGFVTLFVGSGWVRKGLPQAIKATGRLGGTTLLVAGRGPAQKFAGPHVCHLGPLSDLSQAWAAADVLLQPTWYDPFSNACLEGLAAGLPVITTRDNGFCEIIEEERTGTVISRTDATAEIASALRHWRQELAVHREEIHQRCFASALPWSVKRNLEETIAVLDALHDHPKI